MLQSCRVVKRYENRVLVAMKFVRWQRLMMTMSMPKLVEDALQIVKSRKEWHIWKCLIQQHHGTDGTTFSPVRHRRGRLLRLTSYASVPRRVRRILPFLEEPIVWDEDRCAAISFSFCGWLLQRNFGMGRLRDRRC